MIAGYSSASQSDLDREVWRLAPAGEDAERAEEALKDAESLIRLAEDLRDELKHSGEYVVAVSSLRKTEEIEKLARHIRGKLKA